MSQLPVVYTPSFESEVAALAADYRRANGPLMALVNRFGSGIEARFDLVPKPLRVQIERIVVVALMAAHGLAGRGEDGTVQSPHGTTLAAIATGAAGGSGGIVTSIAELPVTITVILRAIRAEAIKAGFDPTEPGVRAACLEVFAAGSPVQADDGVNTGFISTRLAITGPALHQLIARIAPRFASALGQKLAAQAVPVLGAVSGAVLNAAFLSYYREIARIRFALMRLAQNHGGEAVVTAFSRATTVKLVKG
jgi:hypothetical protein